MLSREVKRQAEQGDELAKGYVDALEFLVRIQKAERKLHWEEGDSLEGVLEELNAFLDNHLGLRRKRV
jgi:hypothetical protein